MADQLKLFGKNGNGSSRGGTRGVIPAIPLHDETQRRYLNYALSVITSRALPDVRDGMKPVQRRIVFDMWHDLHLTAEAKFRKCAAVVGDVLGKYHPHGDTSVYDALVRMAQDFSLRYPIVEGHGNFGSLDGDSAAAMRYTECRLEELAGELCGELRQKTIDWRPNYDGTRLEPIVLPAKLPNLLVNGAQGIAVGMACAIPPHNLGEVVEAAIALIDDPKLEPRDLCKFVKGPDFPTGGQLLASRKELRELYESGQGSLKLQAEWKIAEESRGRSSVQQVIVTSVPYGPTKSAILQQIGDLIVERKLSLITDVRDESTSDVRIVLEVKRGADPTAAMAYLFKHTALQTTVQVNFTCLVPTSNPEVGAPERLDLGRMLQHFLDFRLEVTKRRHEFELAELRTRIHVLEGFATVYDAVDEMIRIIRKSEGKSDAAAKLEKRFRLDAEQVEAILELKLYKLAKLEILAIEKELDEKRREAKRIEGLLKSKPRLWQLVRGELQEIGARYADKRRTRVGGAEELEFNPDAYIVHEDVSVVLSRDGWVKRVRELKDVASTRTREGDEVVAVLGGSTRERLVFFTNFGSAYVCQVNDVPPSSGYGDPVQTLFKFKDGERVVGALSLDPRLKPKEAHVLAVTRRGLGLRFALGPHTEPSTRAGRRFAKLGDGDEVVGVRPVAEKSVVLVASAASQVLGCRAGEIHLLQNPGKGVTVIKLVPGDAVLGFTVDQALSVETGKGKAMTFDPTSRSLGSRGGKGHAAARRDGFAKLLLPPPAVPQLAPPGAPGVN